jgi:hypothetical protein
MDITEAIQRTVTSKNYMYSGQFSSIHIFKFGHKNLSGIASQCKTYEEDRLDSPASFLLLWADLQASAAAGFLNDVKKKEFEMAEPNMRTRVIQAFRKMKKKMYP